jgi:isoaspartyl peptidase/L-asparaginase-like protein (Ntn-hydrolase superfamily)
MLSKPPQSNPEILSSRRGAAATLLTRIRNPSQLVKALYLAPNITPHVLLSGEEAQRIGADELGQTVVDPSYFWTEKRWREHRRGLGLPEEPLPYPADGTYNDNNSSLDVAPKGTVGAVALDVNSSIAVVTSTGGLTNKIVGRIGDTPLMGSGFWAEEWPIRSLLKRAWRKCLRKPVNRAVGVSGTGDGDVSAYSLSRTY